MVKESYISYCNYVMEQDRIIEETYKKWVHHFEDCSNPEYLRANAERNKKQKEEDYEQFLKKHKVVFNMVATYDDIPRGIARILGF